MASAEPSQTRCLLYTTNGPVPVEGPADEIIEVVKRMSHPVTSIAVLRHDGVGMAGLADSSSFEEMLNIATVRTSTNRFSRAGRPTQGGIPAWEPMRAGG